MRENERTTGASDSLLTRLSEILDRAVAGTIQHMLDGLRRRANRKAELWTGKGAPPASYWGKIYTVALRKRWDWRVNQLVKRIVRVNQNIHREQFKRMLLAAAKNQRRDPKRIFDENFLLDGPKVAMRMKTFTNRSANLIKKLPRQYISHVAKDAGDAYTGKLTHTEYKQKIIEAIGARTDQQKERAARIAWDQVSKCGAMLTQARCEDNGIEEYIWRTANDKLVAGRPGGLYPPPIDDTSKFHGDHWARRGKKFRWDNPPPDGPPQFAINCRCVAEPIITSFV